ncbi:hypothetical protein P153DRAFT_388068 [Dothidotthia symphoricarpi CBS 119687]|uniref:Uncharacterized protein n=1 Tax=Dothidotthia symphoricarpi CBS 119687 TaxID=1392245 RepID=A0A6A6A6D7_9PLEO|nr:uncharacterized protein P153DRAFT_388068 [Dothidotthia symphoricarpi CBS 119687]KAF2126745.1 hypothetical protein P153DRAFT_388068 [Dothidotthia symphoricarpi CBS 119687]
MAPHKQHTDLLASIALQVIENRETRSPYGDNRAATEDKMMVEHANLARESGLIDEETATQLSQSWHRSGELQMQWKPEYLRIHPEYAAGEKDVAVSLDTAMKRQKEKDRRDIKFIKDWRAGKVDEDGNKIQRNREGMDATEAAEGTSHGSEAASVGGITTPSTRQANSDGRPGSSSSFALASSSPVTGPSNNVSSAKISTSRPEVKHPAKPSPQTYTFASPQTGAQLPPAKSAPLRIRKPKSDIPPPLHPLPNHPDYSSFVYGEVAALCRQRNLPGGGATHELRNRLIQDDINVARGLPREKRTYKGNKRAYKYSAPVLGGVGSQDPNGDSERDVSDRGEGSEESVRNETNDTAEVKGQDISPKRKSLSEDGADEEVDAPQNNVKKRKGTILMTFK